MALEQALELGIDSRPWGHYPTRKSFPHVHHEERSEIKSLRSLYSHNIS